MASSPASRIATAAAQLAESHRSRQPLPSLLFMTDPARTPDPVSVARHLPRGSGVILRHYEEPGRATMARKLANMCKRRGLLFLVGGDIGLARQVGADGVHLPEALVGQARCIRLRHWEWLITGAAHGSRGLLSAAKSGVDAAILAPVFRTDSHPGQPCLGPMRFRALLQSTPIPVYGLGGITVQSIKRMEGAKVAGVAIIGAAMGQG